MHDIIAIMEININSFLLVLYENQKTNCDNWLFCHFQFSENNFFDVYFYFNQIVFLWLIMIKLRTVWSFGKIIFFLSLQRAKSDFQISKFAHWAALDHIILIANNLMQTIPTEKFTQFPAIQAFTGPWSHQNEEMGAILSLILIFRIKYNLTRQAMDHVT